MTPRAAFVIAAHNGERHLDEAIESARGQTLREIEIVVVDDGSTDATPQIVERHAAEDARVRHLRANVGSAGAARNLGRAATEAPFVANLDQDDLAEPERLERQASFLLAHPDVGLVGSYCHIVDDAGHRRGNIAPIAEVDAVTAAIAGGDLGPVTHATATFRRAALEEVGGYRELPGTSVEDVDLYARVAEQWKVANVPELLGSWRVHGGNASLRVETMLRFELLVEAAARERRLGRPDPIAGRDLSEAPSDEELARLGYASDDLRARLFRWHIGWTGLWLTVAEADAAARQLAEAAAAHDASSAGEWAEYLAMRARVEFAQGRYGRSGVTAARAAARSPRQAARSLAHPVIGGAGRALFRLMPEGRASRWARDRVVGRLNRLGSRS